MVILGSGIKSIVQRRNSIPELTCLLSRGGYGCRPMTKSVSRGSIMYVYIMPFFSSTRIFTRFCGFLVLGHLELARKIKMKRVADVC